MKKIVVGLVMLAITVANPAIANTANDEQDVRKVIADYGDAWNKHDPDAILALFTDDADWVNVAGSWWHGLAEHRRGTT
jgi:ketosteroid isomerase-like protein